MFRQPPGTTRTDTPFPYTTPFRSLFSSHNTHDVEQLADSITFLHKGRLVASADKHVFVDSWRRVVCQGALPAGLDAWPEIASARANGSVVEIKARAWNDQLTARLAAQGTQEIGRAHVCTPVT